MENLELKNEEIKETNLENEEKVENTNQNEVQPIENQKKLIKNIKIKFDGKEIEEELPFEIPEDPKTIEFVKRHLQKSKLADRVSREYSELKKTVDEFLSSLKNDPEKILSDPNIGIDLKEFAKRIIEREIERAKKSPEQIQKEEMEKELKRLKEEAQLKEKLLEEERINRLTEKYYQEYDKELTEALKEANLPKSPFIVKRIAEYMKTALNKGIELPVRKAIKLLNEDFNNELKSFFDNLTEDYLEKLIGNNNLERLRKKRLVKKPEEEKNIAEPVEKPKIPFKNQKIEKKIPFSEFFNKN